jgi:hypothetical protein
MSFDAGRREIQDGRDPLPRQLEPLRALKLGLIPQRQFRITKYGGGAKRGPRLHARFSLDFHMYGTVLPSEGKKAAPSARKCYQNLVIHLYEHGAPPVSKYRTAPSAALGRPG